MMTEPGGAYFDAEEAAALRDYLLKGGFLWADDFWGERAWDVWAGEIAKALPSGPYPIVDLPLDHELFHSLYDVTRASADSVDRLLGRHRRRDVRARSTAQCRTCGPSSTITQRIMVLMTHNTDFGDAFERETDDRAYFLEFAARGYAFGVNALIYAMTHLVRLQQPAELPLGRIVGRAARFPAGVDPDLLARPVLSHLDHAGLPAATSRARTESSTDGL